MPSEYKKIVLVEAAEEYHFSFKQTQLSKTISIRIQFPFFWTQHSAVHLPVKHVMWQRAQIARPKESQNIHEIIVFVNILWQKIFRIPVLTKTA